MEAEHRDLRGFSVGPSKNYFGLDIVLPFFFMYTWLILVLSMCFVVMSSRGRKSRTELTFTRAGLAQEIIAVHIFPQLIFYLCIRGLCGFSLSCGL